MSSLTEQLAEMLANSADTEEGKALRLRAIEEVRRSGAAPGLVLGEQIPDFMLPDAYGQEVSSKELLARGPLVISFYRGEWCPYCNVELRALELAASETCLLRRVDHRDQRSTTGQRDLAHGEARTLLSGIK
jgi:hypothetical protein